MTAWSLIPVMVRRQPLPKAARLLETKQGYRYERSIFPHALTAKTVGLALLGTGIEIGA